MGHPGAEVACDEENEAKETNDESRIPRHELSPPSRAATRRCT
jgi:hypothetical protein